MRKKLMKVQQNIEWHVWLCARSNIYPWAVCEKVNDGLLAMLETNELLFDEVKKIGLSSFSLFTKR